MRKKYSLQIGLSVLMALAAEGTADDLGLQALLDDATEVVTESKLNIDYTPSVVVVLKHDQMHLLGAKTLFEALGMLPGIETSINQFGIKKVIFRGFDNPNNFVSDKAKLLIDGVAVEMGKYGNSSFYYDFPIDLIERIEVLRGPGSALYGTGAFNGVINVITRQNAHSGDALFAGYGSHDYMMGGMNASYRLSKESSLRLDGYYQRHDRSVEAGPAYAPIALERPYESSEALRDFSLGLSYNYGPWTFRSRMKRDRNGNYFGWEEYLETHDSYRNVHKHLFAELEYQGAISSTGELTAKLGYSHYDFDMSAGSYHFDPFDPSADPEPFDISIMEKEEKAWFETFVTSEAFEGHEVTAGISLATLRGIENELSVSIPSPYSSPRDLFKEGLIRNTYAAYVRDRVEINPNLFALLSGRADYYGENDKIYPSAQAGLVYMPDGSWHYKLNYGHAFRAPSWMEQYTVEYGIGDGTKAGNVNLDAETTDTLEAVAIWRDGQVHHLQTNLYYSVINDVIDLDYTHAPEYEYDNLDRRKSYGAEVTYTYVTTKLHRFHINASYNRTTYAGPLRREEQTMPGVSQVMLKGYYMHYLTPATTLAANASYFGKRTRNEDFDTDPDGNYDRGCDDYSTVDLTLATKYEDWNFLLSVKNLFDEEIFYPSYDARHIDGIPRDGRNFLFQAEYRF